MNAPTIIRQTRDYLLIKIPLSRGTDLKYPPTPKNGKMTTAEKKLWRAIQEAERDIRKGRVITAPSIDDALKRYAKRQWN